MGTHTHAQWPTRSGARHTPVRHKLVKSVTQRRFSLTYQAMKCVSSRNIVHPRDHEDGRDPVAVAVAGRGGGGSGRAAERGGAAYGRPWLVRGPPWHLLLVLIVSSRVLLHLYDCVRTRAH
jgi:hypothetical protein